MPNQTFSSQCSLLQTHFGELLASVAEIEAAITNFSRNPQAKTKKEIEEKFAPLEERFEAKVEVYENAVRELLKKWYPGILLGEKVEFTDEGRVIIRGDLNLSSRVQGGYFCSVIQEIHGALQTARTTHSLKGLEYIKNELLISKEVFGDFVATDLKVVGQIEPNNTPGQKLRFTVLDLSGLVSAKFIFLQEADVVELRIPELRECKFLRIGNVKKPFVLKKLRETHALEVHSDSSVELTVLSVVEQHFFVDAIHLSAPRLRKIGTTANLPSVDTVKKFVQAFPVLEEISTDARVANSVVAEFLRDTKRSRVRCPKVYVMPDQPD